MSKEKADTGTKRDRWKDRQINGRTDNEAENDLITKKSAVSRIKGRRAGFHVRAGYKEKKQEKA